MSYLVQTIKNTFPSSCIVETCEENDCRVCLEGAPTPNIIVDFDGSGALSAPHEICDYLFVADNGQAWVVPLELTRGTTKCPSKVIAQLGAGAKIAADHIHSGGNINFRPVFVGTTDKRMRKYLRKNKVKFHKKGAHAKWIECGDCLSKGLT